MIRYVSHADDAKRRLDEARETILTGIGEIGISAAKALAPVDSGTLRWSISYETGDREVAIGTNVEYAPHVEMGTSRWRGKPFLLPGVLEARSKIQALAEMILGQQFRR